MARVLAVHGLFGLEVYDARVAESNPAQADATAIWDRLLSAGNRVCAFVGSGRDGHVLKAVAASTGSYQVRGDEGLRPRGSDQGKHRLAVRLRP